MDTSRQTSPRPEPPLRNLCVFCGSSSGNRPIYLEAARDLGAALARRGVGLVYGGAHCGLMGALADAALAGGGRVVGVIPRALVALERAHGGLTELVVTPDMHTRKARMAELSDGFLALPGGFGTLDELCEMVTWAQLGLHRKPIGLLDVDGYWDGLLALLARGVHDGFIPSAHDALLKRHADPDGILDLLAQGAADPGSKWVAPSGPAL
jgi:uncharacterized protein (TIGR00730 family)